MCPDDDTETWVLDGNSKTVGDEYGNELISLMLSEESATIQTDNLAASIMTAAKRALRIEADMASFARRANVTKVLVNLGVNEATVGLPTEAAWKASMQTLLDAYEAEWPGVDVYLMRPWGRGLDAECNTLAGWIADLVAASATVHSGPDERVFLENGDDGTTYTVDGVHPTAGGYDLTAAEWKTAVGF